MDSANISRMNGAASPDDNSIMIVTQGCNCDKERAIALLAVTILHGTVQQSCIN